MAFQGFVNLLVRPDISLEERLMVCKTLADLSASSAVNSLKIIRTNGLPEAFSAILRETGSALGHNNSSSAANRTDERHQTYIALCISRCSSRTRLNVLGDGIHTEVCLKLARTEGLVDGLWALKKHPESFVQICSAVALSSLCQCEEAVGTNRRLMRFKWNSNVLQLPAPSLRRSLGQAPASADEATHPAQGDMWRIEEDQTANQPPPHPLAAPAAGAASFPTGASQHPGPASRFAALLAPPAAAHPSLPQPTERPAAAPFAPAPQYGISTNRWDGAVDGMQVNAVEKEDSWASARETKPGAGYYSSQARCRSPYSSGGHSSGPFSSAGSAGAAGCDAGHGGTGGVVAPPRVYSRTDVNFDASSIKHCMSIGSPSHPARDPGAARLSATGSGSGGGGSGGGGAVSTKHASPTRDPAAYRT